MPDADRNNREALSWRPTYMKQTKTGFKHVGLPTCVTVPILSFSFTGASDLHQHSENQKSQSAEVKLNPT